MNDRRPTSKVCQNPTCKKAFITTNKIQKYHSPQCTYVHRQMRKKIIKDRIKIEKKEKHYGFSTMDVMAIRENAKLAIKGYLRSIIRNAYLLDEARQQFHDAQETLKSRKEIG